MLSMVADKEGVELPDQAVEAEVERLRGSYRDNPRMLAYFESERGRSYLRSSLRRTRVVEELVDRWLAAHPEVGPLPHLEDNPATAAPEAASDEEVRA